LQPQRKDRKEFQFQGCLSCGHRTPWSSPWPFNGVGEWSSPVGRHDLVPQSTTFAVAQCVVVTTGFNGVGERSVPGKGGTISCLNQPPSRWHSAWSSPLASMESGNGASPVRAARSRASINHPCGGTVRGRHHWLQWRPGNEASPVRRHHAGTLTPLAVN
jgi:hypothetical protein